MTDDFEAFVGKAFPGLLRFGHVLTGDEDDARRLVGSTLAAVRWRRVRTSSDPVAEVRRAMAREYAGWPEPTPRPAPGSRSPATDHPLTVLSPRQRAVTVLRYGEDLSDRDAAEALGVGIGAAKSDAGVALSRMRATYPDDDRPDATELGRELRTLLSTAGTDVEPGELTVAGVARAARRTARRRTALTATAIVGAAALVAGGAVMLTRGGDDVTADASPSAPTVEATPTAVSGIGEVDVSDLTVVTPDDFPGELAIGMTVAEVEGVLGDDAVFREEVPGVDCALQVELGAEIRAWFEPWPVPEEGAEPDPDAELLVTEVAYYGKDAKTLAETAVGMRISDLAPSGGELVATPLGDGVQTVYTPANPSGSWGIVGGIGYRVWPPTCGIGLVTGASSH